MLRRSSQLTAPKTRPDTWKLDCLDFCQALVQQFIGKESRNFGACEPSALSHLHAPPKKVRPKKNKAPNGDSIKEGKKMKKREGKNQVDFFFTLRCFLTKTDRSLASRIGSSNSAVGI